MPASFLVCRLFSRLKTTTLYHIASSPCNPATAQSAGRSGGSFVFGCGGLSNANARSPARIADLLMVFDLSVFRVRPTTGRTGDIFALCGRIVKRGEWGMGNGEWGMAVGSV